MRKFTIYSCSSCKNTGQVGSKYFKRIAKETLCLTCNSTSNIHILQHESNDEELCSKECGKMFNCCNCGGNNCGCNGCWSCNACEDCLNED